MTLAAAAPVGAPPAEVIARAREYLGGDAALDAVRSIHFTGIYESEMDGETHTGTIDMIFEKPYLHRSIIQTEGTIEKTGLDDLEGWLWVEDANDPTRWRLTNFGKDQTKALRANTWESLNFYKGIESRGGKVIDLGEASIDNVVCDKLAFQHDADIVFYRYFDRATGKLMLTETSQGATREEGSQMIDGVRFPQRIVSTVRMEGEKERTVTLTFQSITVNEPHPHSVFQVPSVPVPSLFPKLDGGFNAVVPPTAAEPTDPVEPAAAP